MLIACRLGLADLRHERLMAVCQGLALAAVLAPLLILYGLKHGIVTRHAAGAARAAGQPRDPGARQQPPDGRTIWRRSAALPEVGFLVPKPRSFARTLYLERASGDAARACSRPI